MNLEKGDIQRQAQSWALSFTLMWRYNVYHFCLKLWFITFWEQNLRCVFLLPSRHTERWIKTSNTQGQNLLVLIRGKGSFGSFRHHTTEPSSWLACWLLCSGCTALKRRWVPGHTWPAMHSKSEDLSTDVLPLPGNCRTISSFICSQHIFANGDCWRMHHGMQIV